MTHLRSLLAVGLVALVVAVAPTFAASNATPKLQAAVGPGFTITLKKGGKKVTTLKKGKYTIVVADKSDIHNFHVRGPGVNKMTGVAFVGTKSFTVTLKAGRYTFICDPHPTSMKGSFRVS